MNKNKNKIIFLSPVGYFKGGAERSLLDLLNNPNIEPVLVVPEKGPISEWAHSRNIKYYLISFGAINKVLRPFSFLKSIGALKSLFYASKELSYISRLERAEIIHSNGLKAHIINCTCKLFYKTKAIVHIRDIPYTKSEQTVWLLMGLLASKIIIVSKPCWPNNLFLKKTRIIYNSTDLKPFESHKNYFEKSPITIGFCGRMHPSKGLHLLIDWVYEAIQKGLSVNLSIRGEFSADSPNYENEIKKQIISLEMEKFIHFKGFIGNIDEVYKGIDIAVVPSNIPDPLPRTVMESMSRGLIVFGYPAGGITEMIEHEVSGFLVKDKDSFLKSLELVLNNHLDINKIRFNAIQKIKKKFSREEQYKKLDLVYKGVMRL